MLETVITLKPKSEWRRVDTWYSAWAPEWLKVVLRHVTPDHLSDAALVEQLDRALRLPGVSNGWTMPIKARIDMLTTGIRTPVGLKISGADLRTIEDIGAQVEAALPGVPGTRNVFAERAGGGFFLDIAWKRIAAPMVGGIFTSFLLELVVYPAIYEIWKWHFEMKRNQGDNVAMGAVGAEAS